MEPYTGESSDFRGESKLREKRIKMRAFTGSLMGDRRSRGGPTFWQLASDFNSFILKKIPIDVTNPFCKRLNPVKLESTNQGEVKCIR